MKEIAIAARNRTNVRLRTTLALLADHQAAGSAVAPSQLMAEAVAQVPFDATEAELLSGGVPRGFKALTTATSKLVKAGWLVKGRTGWTATEEGVRAVRAFDDADQFVNAMLTGAPVPEHTDARVHAPAAPAAAGRPETGSAEESAGQATEDPTPPDVTPTIDVVPEASEDTEGTEDTDAPDAPAASADAWHGQPQSVALSGNFDPLFGEAGHWSTGLRELQLDYEPAANTWVRTLALPAGNYQYKILLNGSWDENYGRFGVRDGENHELHLLSDTAVTIRFDHATKDITAS